MDKPALDGKVAQLESIQARNLERARRAEIERRWPDRNRGDSGWER